MDRATDPNNVGRDRKIMPPQEAVARSFSPTARCLVTAPASPEPAYLDALTREVSALDAVPGAAATRLRTRAFDQVAICWTPGDGSPVTAISGQVWAFADGPGWIRVEGGAFSDLGPSQEIRIPGTALRDTYVQITAMQGGVGALTLYTGGI